MCNTEILFNNSKSYTGFDSSSTKSWSVAQQAQSFNQSLQVFLAYLPIFTPVLEIDVLITFAISLEEIL